MKTLRCKHCHKKTEMKQSDSDWLEKFYQCPHCEQATPMRTALGHTLRIGKVALTVGLLFFGVDLE